MKNSQDIINYLIKNNNYTRFLEIGVRPNNKGMSINQIECEHKDGVDTQPNRCNYTMTSDEFFNAIPSTQTSNGIILCHDINPPSLMHLNPDLCWNAWEAWAELRCTRSDLQMYSLDIDMGPGIIVKGKQEIYKKEVLPTWEYLDLNRKELLNSIPVEKFTELF